MTQQRPARSENLAEAEAAAPADLEVFDLAHGEERFVVFSFTASAFDAVGLTPAERAVMHHLLQGWTNAEIGRHRGTSERTVANQIAAVLRKLGAKSRLELAALSLGEPVRRSSRSG